MQRGDSVYAEYRDSLVEVLDVTKNEVQIITVVVGDSYYAVWVPKKALKKIGVL